MWHRTEFRRCISPGNQVFSITSVPRSRVGGDFHRLKSLTARYHLDSHPLLGFAALQFEFLWLVAHHAETHGGIALVVADREPAVHVGLGSDGGAVEYYLNEGDGLIGFGIAHTALNGRRGALCQSRQWQKEQ